MSICYNTEAISENAFKNCVWRARDAHDNLTFIQYIRAGGATKILTLVLGNIMSFFQKVRVEALERRPEALQQFDRLREGISDWLQMYPKVIHEAQRTCFLENHQLF